MDKNFEDSISNKLLKWFKKDFDWVADFEIFIAAIIASIIILSAPLIFALYLAKHDYQGYAIGLVLIWLLFIAQLVKDYRQKKFSVISKVLSVVWIVLVGSIVFILKPA